MYSVHSMRVRLFGIWALAIAIDIALALGIYFSLPSPKALLKGQTLERQIRKPPAKKGAPPEIKIVKFQAGPLNRRYVRLRKIPKTLWLSVVTLEDGRFFQHQGFDGEEILNALSDRWEGGARLRGASTLTQQLVKNLYLSPDRTFRRKFVEAFISIRFEMELSKNEILELYLNSIDWGRGVFGIWEASQYYFKKPPQDLTPKEAVFLAAIIPNPARFGRLSSLGVPRQFVRRQMVRALDALFQAGIISFEVYQDAIETPFYQEPVEGPDLEGSETSQRTPMKE